MKLVGRCARCRQLVFVGTPHTVTHTYPVPVIRLQLNKSLTTTVLHRRACQPR